MQNFRLSFALILISCFLFMTACGGGSGGSTPPTCVSRAPNADEIAINSPSQLAGMGLTGKYILTSNISLAGINWAPIGGRDVFTGELDGNCYTITDLTIDNEGVVLYAGLFSLIDGAKISKLILKDVNINVEYYGDIVPVGSIAAIARDSVIENSSSTGNITALGDEDISAGGLVGHAVSTITVNNSYSTVDIDASGVGDINAAGLIGVINGSGDINDSYSTGDITASGADAVVAAGLIAWMLGGDISNSYSTAYVNASANMQAAAGGIVGYAKNVSISGSHSSGDYIIASGGYADAGGLIGWMIGGSISNSYSTSDVASDGSETSAGGIAGYAEHADITKSYNTGFINTIATNNDANAGGIVGFADIVRISNSYSTGPVGAFSTNADANAGGIAGWIQPDTDDLEESSIKYSYSTGKIKAETDTDSGAAGGIAGWVSEGGVIVEHCAAINKSIFADSSAGWIIGYIDGGDAVISDNIALATISNDGGVALTTDGSSKTSAELQLQSTYSNIGWDFTNIWTMDNYPMLFWQK